MQSYSWAITIRPLDGMKDEMVQAVLKFFKDVPYIYSMEKDGSERHMHMGTFYKRNPGVQLHRALVKAWPLSFGNKPVCMKIKTWFKGDLGDGTWIDYLSKDGTPITNQSEDFNWHELLADDKAIEDRRKQSWQQMHYYSELFETHELPHKTVDEVMDGLEELAYVLKVSSLPRWSERKGLKIDLFHYMSKTKGGEASAEALTKSHKRKREEEEPPKWKASTKGVMVFSGK
jgi:hypothetical protein